LDSSEITAGILVMDDTPLDEKINQFLNVCVENNVINKKDFIRLLGSGCDPDEKKKITEYTKQVFKSIDLDKNGKIDKYELKWALLEDKNLSKIIDKNLCLNNKSEVKNF